MVIHCIVRLVDPINQGKQNNSFLERRRRCYGLVTLKHWVAHYLALVQSYKINFCTILVNAVQIRSTFSCTAALNFEE